MVVLWFDMFNNWVLGVGWIKISGCLNVFFGVVGGCGVIVFCKVDGDIVWGVCDDVNFEVFVVIGCKVLIFELFVLVYGDLFVCLFKLKVVFVIDIFVFFLKNVLVVNCFFVIRLFFLYELVRSWLGGDWIFNKSFKDDFCLFENFFKVFVIFVFFLYVSFVVLLVFGCVFVLIFCEFG